MKIQFNPIKFRFRSILECVSLNWPKLAFDWNGKKGLKGEMGRGKKRNAWLTSVIHANLAGVCILV